MATRTGHRASPRGRRPLLICFIGVDGSGKSTQARMLVSWLTEQGFQTKYVWNRYEPWFLKPAMLAGRVLFLRGRDMFKDYGGYSSSKRRAFRVPVLAPIFQFLYLAEYPLHALKNVWWPLSRGHVVVCDRYYHDVVAGSAADFHLPRRKSRAALAWFLRLLPKPDTLFLIDVPAEIAFHRKDDIPAPEFIESKRLAYLDIAEALGVSVVDGLQKPEIIEAAVRETVCRCLK